MPERKRKLQYVFHGGRLLFYHPGDVSTAPGLTVTESVIFEASQEKWDTFNNCICLRGISVYYFKVSQVFVRCVYEKSRAIIQDDFH